METPPFAASFVAGFGGGRDFSFAGTFDHSPVPPSFLSLVFVEVPVVAFGSSIDIKAAAAANESATPGGDFTGSGGERSDSKLPIPLFFFFLLLPLASFGFSTLEARSGKSSAITNCCGGCCG